MITSTITLTPTDTEKTVYFKSIKTFSFVVSISGVDQLESFGLIDQKEVKDLVLNGIDKNNVLKAADNDKIQTADDFPFSGIKFKGTIAAGNTITIELVIFEKN